MKAKKNAENDSVYMENLRIGRQIRDLRKAKGITLTTMAERIGRSTGYISQVERGVSALPIPVLQSISDVLGVNVSWFFHTDNQVSMDELNHVVRKDARRSLNFANGIREELLSPRMSGQLQLVLTTLSPQAGDTERRERKSEEAGFVQSGVIELGIGDKVFRLQEGDSFSLNDDQEHWIRNPSEDTDAVLIWVLSGGHY